LIYIALSFFFSFSVFSFYHPNTFSFAWRIPILAGDILRLQIDGGGGFQNLDIYPRSFHLYFLHLFISFVYLS